MNSLASWLGVGGLLLAVVVHAAPAQAQLPRTWVSGAGDDHNPCSRALPCKTFNRAIANTDPGGTISVLDPGGYGPLAITKAISINNEGGGEAGIFASTIGITIAAGTKDVVSLRGLIIDGVYAEHGSIGVSFTAGRSLHIDNCVIRNFTGPDGVGISFTPGNGGRLFISNTIIANNGTATSGGGLIIKPTGSVATLATLGRVQVLESGPVGIAADSTGMTDGGVKVTVLDTVVSAGAGTGIKAVSATTGTPPPARIVLNRSTSVYNATLGVGAEGWGSTILLGNTTITGNAKGVETRMKGILGSYKNNAINDNNRKDGTPIAPAPLN